MSMFPSMINNEPPPFVDEEDNEGTEFDDNSDSSPARFKLDISSADPTPDTSPVKSKPNLNDLLTKRNKEEPTGPTPSTVLLSEEVNKKEGQSSVQSVPNEAIVEDTAEDEFPEAFQSCRSTVPVHEEHETETVVVPSSQCEDVVVVTPLSTDVDVVVVDNIPEPEVCEDPSRSDHEEEQVKVTDVEQESTEQVRVTSDQVPGEAPTSGPVPDEAVLETVSLSVPSQPVDNEESDGFDDDDFPDDFQSCPAVPEPISGIMEPKPELSPPTIPIPETSNSNFFNVDWESSPATSEPASQRERKGSESGESHIPNQTQTSVILKSLFDLSQSDSSDKQEGIIPIDKQLSTSAAAKKTSDPEELIWHSIQDFESSQALLFKWVQSISNQHLLRTLNIDHKAVVSSSSYCGKWGLTELPRYAASIASECPLQPVQSHNIPLSSPSSAPTTSAIILPEVIGKLDALDVNYNNSSNARSPICSETNDVIPTMPVAISKPAADDGSSQQITNNNDLISLSPEARNILEQLPDLSFMRAKTLIFNNQVNNE